MHNWPKLDQSLILNPPIGVIKTSLEKFYAFWKLFKFITFYVFYQIGQFFDADFPRAPNLIGIELFESTIHFLDECIVIKVLRNGNQSWQEELLDLEERIGLDLLEVLIQEVLALLLLEDVFFRKSLDDDEHCYFGPFFDVLWLLVLAWARDSVHDYRNNFLHQTLGLVFWNICFGEVEKGVNSFELDSLLTQHQHTRNQWENVDCYYIDYFSFWYEQLRFK